MFHRQPSAGFDERLPRVFAPRVAPDPEVQQKLEEKIARSQQKLRERLDCRYNWSGRLD